MSFDSEFSRIQQEVQSKLESFKLLIECTLLCKGHIKYTDKTSNGKIIIHTLTACGIIKYLSSSGNGVEDVLTLAYLNVTCDNIFISYDDDEEMYYVQINNGVMVDLKEFYNIDKEQYINLNMQYQISEIKMKYIMGYAILLLDGICNAQHFNLGVYPENIEQIGLDELLPAMREFNESQNTKAIQS